MSNDRLQGNIKLYVILIPTCCSWLMQAFFVGTDHDTMLNPNVYPTNMPLFWNKMLWSDDRNYMEGHNNLVSYPYNDKLVLGNEKLNIQETIHHMIWPLTYGRKVHRSQRTNRPYKISLGGSLHLGLQDHYYYLSIYLQRGGEILALPSSQVFQITWLSKFNDKKKHESLHQYFQNKKKHMDLATTCKQDIIQYKVFQARLYHKLEKHIKTKKQKGLIRVCLTASFDNYSQKAQKIIWNYFLKTVLWEQK